MEAGALVAAYRVVREIGRGGMGSVWLAEHVALGRRAALKVLHAEFSHREEITTRFFNEARAATAIHDPGIVQIFDFGHHTDGSAYIVMELLDGEPLSRRLEHQGALAIADALRIMRQVASTLGAAHARGIIHRDLKPENIFLVRDPEVAGGERAKILDFGIAKLTGDAGGVKTQTSAMMGTPMYMSPEQCRGAGQVDQRTDVYALGCVLFALITGRPPFNAEGVGELIVMHMREPAPAPSSLRAGIPTAVDQLVLRCLAKDPAQRFASATDLASAIAALALALPSSSQAVAISSAGVAAARTTLSTASGFSSTPMIERRSRRPVIAVAIALVGVGGGATYLALSSSGGGREEPVATAPAPTPPPAAAPEARPPAPAPDPRAEVLPRMKDALAAFVAWSAEHHGAPCPDVSSLRGASNDPWGHPFSITCVDQPGDQVIGVTSAGPDGIVGTADDIASWQLGREVTDLVRGARWTVAAKLEPHHSKLSAPKASASAKPAEPAKPGGPAPGKPALQLDENGMPVTR